MKTVNHVSRFISILGIVALAALSPALAQDVPFKVFITELWQLDDGVDPGIGLIADYYAKVTINGATQDNDGACDDGSLTGILVPLQMFKNFDKISECGARTPWVFSRLVPAGQPVTVKIQIFDSDTLSDDEADLKPGAGNAVEFTVDPVTGRWSGGDADADYNWPQNCSRPALSLGGNNANACWQAGMDTDEDGLLDVWETSGVDTDNDAAIDLDLAALGADPRRPDVFLEADFLQASNHTHSPNQTAISRIVTSFAGAPVSNPDGTTGVQLHVDVGPIYGAGAVLTVAGAGGVTGTYGDLGGGTSAIPEAGNEIIEEFGDGPGNGTPFEDLKRAQFDPRREPVFRYTIFGHQTNARVDTDDCTSGQASSTRRDFMVTLGGSDADGTPCWTTDLNGHSVGSIGEQAGTLMHEIGHTLGLDHGGDADINNKPNYLSVMNYSFQSCGVPAAATLLPGGCDYSRLVLGALLPPLDEIDLDECVGIGGGLPFGAMDWNGDGIFEGVSMCGPIFANTDADVNNDGVCVTAGDDKDLDSSAAGDDREKESGINDGADRICDTAASGDDDQVTVVGGTPKQPQVLTSFDDWNSLVPSLIDFTPSSGSGSDAEEPDSRTLRQARLFVAETLTPQVTIDQTGPATGVPGDVLTYAVQIRNTGRGPGVSSVLQETTPDGSSRTTDLDVLAVGAAADSSATFTVPDDACPGDFTGAGASIAFQDFAGTPLSASDSTPLQILDIEPPTLTVVVSPAILWPPNHQFVEVTATITVTDNCDSDPDVTLVSITSSEPEFGYIGAGDQGPDITGAALGTDDRAFLLRSERKTGMGRTGRVYTITYRATDVSGNAADTVATVTVPANQRLVAHVPGLEPALQSPDVSSSRGSRWGTGRRGTQSGDRD